MPNRLGRFCDGVMEAGWLLALIVTPLFFDVYSARVFEPDKVALLRSLALVVLAAWLVKLWSERGPRFENLSPQHFDSLTSFFRLPLMAPVGDLSGVYLLATFFSIVPHASLLGSYQRLQGTFTTFSYLVLFSAMAGNLRQRVQVERLLTTIVLTSLPVSLYGIVQHFRLDPLHWGGDTAERVTASMGNAIFLAAYLILSALIVLGRVAANLHALRSAEESDLHGVVRAVIYVFILALNLIAIWFTGSRGPWLGLLAGLFFFFVLLALYWRIRVLALGTIGLAALLAIFLIVLNIPNGPLESLRQRPGISRLGTVFETEGGTGRVRVLIWDGVIQLMRPHPPLEYFDSRTNTWRADTWNSLRPIIGYGPESLYVAFNRFYPPELGQIEARTASPDRSHNETFDALAFTGLLGLGVYLALFVAVFYYGLKWLGLIATSRRRTVFLISVLGGGAASASGFVLWQGPEYFGVGLPLGVLLGLIAFLTLYALRSGPETAIQEPWRATALISLLAAVVAHFTEIHFGIAIVSTRTHFWIFVALMWVLGVALPAARGATSPAPTETAVATRRKHRSSSSRRSAPGEGPWLRSGWGPAGVGAGLMTAILVTLGFDFISNPSHATGPFEILREAFVGLPPEQGSTPASGILGLILITWLAGGALGYLEEARGSRSRSGLAKLGAGLGVAFFLSGLSWLVISGRLAAIAASVPASVPELLASARSIADLVTLYYVELLLLLLGLALMLPTEWPTGPVALGGVSILVYIVVPVLAVLLAVLLNLQVIRADVIYKTGLGFDNDGQPLYAIPLYEEALANAPGEDYYYLFLGRAFLNAIGVLSDPAEREQVLERAEADLLLAREFSPLNTDHTANLARLNQQWALLTTDPSVRAQRAAQANDYYQQAVRLSPNNAGLWNEWARLAYQLLGDPEAAQAKLNQSFALDRKFPQTYQIQAELYFWRARQATDPTVQPGYVQQAIAAYSQGLAIAEEVHADTLSFHLGLASAYASAKQLQPAIDEYLRVVQLGAGSNLWQIYRNIAELYRQMGDVSQARRYGQLALDAAPDTNKVEVQTWLNALP